MKLLRVLDSIENILAGIIGFLAAFSLWATRLEWVNKLIYKRRNKMDILDQNLGNVGKIEIDIIAGKLVAKTNVAISNTGVSAGLVVEVDACVVLDKIAAAIPGQVDDAVIAVMKAALQTMK